MKFKLKLSFMSDKLFKNCYKFSNNDNKKSFLFIYNLAQSVPKKDLKI